VNKEVRLFHARGIRGDLRSPCPVPGLGHRSSDAVWLRSRKLRQKLGSNGPQSQSAARWTLEEDDTLRGFMNTLTLDDDKSEFFWDLHTRGALPCTIPGLAHRTTRAVYQR
jgi:hypothetical protein